VEIWPVTRGARFAPLAGALILVIIGTIRFGTAQLEFVMMLIITGTCFDQVGVLGSDLRSLNPNRIFGIGLMMLGPWFVIK